MPFSPSLTAALLALTACAGAWSAEYAVLPAPAGDDGGNGSADRPFATIAHALGRAGAGDTVWLSRGAVYREAGLDIHGGVTVKAAGAANRPPPLITASVKVEGFKPWAKNGKVLTAKVAGPILDCYVDGRLVLLARYPNAGWMRSGKGSTPDAITDPARAKAPGAAAGRWKGAQVRWRRWSWWWETRPVTDDDGASRIGLGADGRFQDGAAGVGSAWYVDNCLAELDAPGEWFWEASSGLLYLYPPADAEPASMMVEAVPDAKECAIAGATLDGVGFARFPRNALSVREKSQIVDCSFQDIGDTAIGAGWNSAGSLVRGCTFRDVRNVGVSWLEDPQAAGGTVIERCQFERIGMVFGYGGSGAWHAAGVILSNGKPVTLRLNRMMDVGGCGVILGYPGCLVERNVFVRCMGSLNDGAAIYANCDASIIRENIVLDTVGNLETSQPWYPLGHGIWLEFLKDFKDSKVIGNTVFGSGGDGLFLPNNYTCEVRENVLVGNRTAALLLSGKAGSAQRHTVADNVLATLVPSRRIKLAEPVAPDWDGDYERCLDFEDGIDYGAMSGTVLVAPPVPAQAPGGASSASAAPLAVCARQRWDDIAAWAKDRHWADAGARAVRGNPLLLINDTAQPHDFTLPSSGWSDLAGHPAKTVTVAAYRSAVLVRAGADAGALPPYLVASGTDYRAATFAGAASGPSSAKKQGAEKSPDDKPANGKPPSAKKDAAEPEAKASMGTPKPEAWKRYVEQLRASTAALAASKHPPAFHYGALNSDVTVIAASGDSFTLKLGPDGGEIATRLFAKLAPEDALSLALDAQRKDQAAEHAMAAFFARCAGNGVAYQKHLAQAGELAATVEAGFDP